MTHRFLGVTGIICGILFFRQALTSCVSRNEGSGSQMRSALTAAAADSADANYRKYCASCHGEKMEAFTDRRWKYGKSDADLYRSIHKGYPDGGMPSFAATFSEAETRALVGYLQGGIAHTARFNFEQEQCPNVSNTRHMKIRLDTVVTGIDVPWGMAFLPEGGYLITDRTGQLYRVDEKRQRFRVKGVPSVLAEGQGGLLDIALHPDFNSNRLVYLAYSKSIKEGDEVLSTTAVVAARLNGDRLIDEKEVFVALPYFTTRHHYGSRLCFDDKGHLYVAVGDRGKEKLNPQNLGTHPGKVHRIFANGTIPPDNPFADSTGAVRSIYTYGHRNIQGMALNPFSGELWTNEHGPRGGDEINIEQAGRNYGWPIICFGLNYNGTLITKDTAGPGLEQPLHYWLPSIAPSGMAFVTGNRYKGWEGNLLVGSLRFKYLNRCVIRNGRVVEEEPLFRNIGRLRDVRMGPDGYIYISVEQGAVYRLVPVDG
jgi:glucose/arabinose dehydrogenase